MSSSSGRTSRALMSERVSKRFPDCVAHRVMDGAFGSPGFLQNKKRRVSHGHVAQWQQAVRIFGFAQKSDSDAGLNRCAHADRAFAGKDHLIPVPGRVKVRKGDVTPPAVAIKYSHRQHFKSAETAIPTAHPCEMILSQDFVIPDRLGNFVNRKIERPRP